MAGVHGIRFHRPSRIIALAAFLASTGIVSLAHAAIPDSERQALLDFYQSTDGEHWSFHTNWNGAPGSECTWAGIICDDGQTHVVGIDFGDIGFGTGNNLQGALPPSLADLAALQTLEVSGNHLTGTVPPLTGMGALTLIDLRNNAFTGPFPALTGLSNLVYFSGSGGNLFDGPIPPLTGLDSLQYFDCDYCNVDGPLPDLAGAPALISFSAKYNSLTGPIPSLAALTQLSDFEVPYNLLTGPLPPITSTGSVNVSYNNLSGPIPPAYMSLGTFVARDNQLSGPIPAPTAAIAAIALDDNSLEGPLPSLAQAANLVTFSVSNNQLTGRVQTLDGLANLTFFNIKDNALSGDLPPVPNDQIGTAYLCPNNFNPTPDAAWDTVSGISPWYAGCATGSHQNINQPGLSGTWYNPATGGQGVVLSSIQAWQSYGPLPATGTLFGGWFTYASEAIDDPAGQSWYSFQGDIDDSTGQATLGLYEIRVGRFGGAPIAALTRIGTITLAFDDCTHATMTYHFDDARVADGSFPLQRLTGNTTCTRSGSSLTPVSNSRYSGAYYEPAISGQGLMIDISATMNTLFAAWYTFSRESSADNRRWYSLQANIDPATTSMTGVPIYATVGGAFGASTPVTTTSVGTADISFTYCGEMTLSYHFTSGENAGIASTRTLSRLGPALPGCN